MNESGKIKICTFLHYSTSLELPFYVRIYIEELSVYFEKVFVLSNSINLHKHNLSLPENIDFVHFENKGYDFGLFYRFIITQNLKDFSQIAIINDSNILINKLEAVFQNEEHAKADFWGIIDSNEKPWFSTHQENYHIQSHFIVFNENAVKYLPDFFENIDIQQILFEKDIKKLRRLVIDQWEIGLSQFLLSKGLKSNSFINSVSFLAEHKSKGKNITHSLYKELIMEGYPLIKKKIILSKSWRSVFGMVENWEKLLAKYAFREWNISLLIDEIKK